MRPTPPKQVKHEKRNAPAIAILRIERPLGFELIDHLKPKQRKNPRRRQQTPRENFRAGRFAETRASEEGFHLCARVAAWKQVASLQDGRARLYSSGGSDRRRLAMCVPHRL